MGVLWGGVHMRQIIKHAFYLAVGIVLALSSARSAYAQEIMVTTKKVTLADGATYLIQFPTSTKWNGTLFLYSHGYVTPGSNNPAQDAGDPVTQGIMLANGFALAGSSYAHTGWAVQEALLDQMAVLDIFKLLVGQTALPIAGGHSLGGILIPRRTSRV